MLRRSVRNVGLGRRACRGRDEPRSPSASRVWGQATTASLVFMPVVIFLIPPSGNFSRWLPSRKLLQRLFSRKLPQQLPSGKFPYLLRRLPVDGPIPKATRTEVCPRELSPVPS